MTDKTLMVGDLMRWSLELLLDVKMRSDRTVLLRVKDIERAEDGQVTVRMEHVESDDSGQIMRLPTGGTQGD